MVETHGRKAIAELAAQLESVPRRQLEYKGTFFEEMDVDAILARKPQVVLVDELAHTNIEGSKHTQSATKTCWSCSTPTSTCSPP